MNSTWSSGRMRYSGTCGVRAGPGYSPWANACQGIGPQTFQCGSPQPVPCRQSTPWIGGRQGPLQTGGSIVCPGAACNKTTTVRSSDAAALSRDKYVGNGM